MSARLATADREAADMIAVADRKAAETEADLEALQRAVAAGDERITPTSVSRAWDAVEHAQLARTGARVRARDHRMAGARAELAAIAAELDGDRDTITGAREYVAETLETAQAALAALADAVDRHDGLIAPYHARLIALRPRLDRVDNPLNDVKRHNAHIYEAAGVKFGNGSLEADGWRAEPVRVGRALASALAPVGKRLSSNLADALSAEPKIKGER